MTILVNFNCFFKNINESLTIHYTISNFGERTNTLQITPGIETSCQRWHEAFESIVKTGLFDDVEIGSGGNCADSAQELEESFNQLLNSEPEIKNNLDSALNTKEDILFLVKNENTNNDDLRKYPWQCYNLLKEYKNSEIALAKINFNYNAKLERNYSTPVKILVVFGTEQSEQQEPTKLKSFKTDIKNLKYVIKYIEVIDSDHPDDLPNKLPSINANTAYIILATPKSTEDLKKYIKQGCDIFCYIGHSNSAENNADGYIYLESNNRKVEKINISVLRDCLNEVREHKNNPLQLAIFTSCKGFGLADVFDKLNIPNIIAMRSLLPLEVGRKFLREFLTNFIQDKNTLHIAVRKARDILEENYGNQYPGVQWLPQLFLHPEAAKNILTWDGLITSPFIYIERPPLEKRCYDTMIQSGSLLRLRSAKGMGKSLLIDNILSGLNINEYKVVKLNFLEADQNILNDLDRLGKWFCKTVSRRSNISDEVTKRWEEDLGKINVSYYLEEYLLPSFPQDLVLVLDNVEELFPHKNIADEFFSLFRIWRQEANTRKIWQKLHLIMAYSTEEYMEGYIDINHSPLENVGEEIELPDFSSEQILELANGYDAGLTKEDIHEITQIVGGHLYLIQKAIYAMAKQQLSLENFILTATTEEGIYGDHLRGLWFKLQKFPELQEGMQKVVTSSTPVDLGTMLNKKLHSLGLVKFEHNAIKPRYQLYAQYFSDRLT
ncbi:MAG: AAA-like domain-containing protein [Gomphosphaeria aponina SAG 52.96 = DSM 107014]|uniref:AAA-like domain-containing protein n=1 Tax=Gomphosphaeria aponina SAG 52.96 = DSM 107014 TaxID=1521640 RepID=A0A941GME2_9CHRO|nr:AAA-like domain-containing protein [Gomphosphaeria aponina SAG 52.96 = DSM 107014]